MKSKQLLSLAAAFLISMAAFLAQAEPVYVPNADFGQPVVTNLDTEVAINMIDWGTFPPYPDTEGAIGVFTNDPNDGAYINNCIGPQGAFIFEDPGILLFQDYNATDSTGAQSTNFSATYDVGRYYQLQAGFIPGLQEFPLTPGAILQMSLYYRDASNNRVTIAATNIVYDTNVFTGDTNFVTVTLTTPPVQSSNAWVSQHIGIQFAPVGSIEGGYWDLGNVQLSSFIYVPNADFGLPVVTNLDTEVAINIIDWGTFPPYPDTEGAIGVFTNDPDDGAYIVNCDGPQGAYIYEETGISLFQDYNATDSTGAQSTGLSATYEVGKYYQLQAGFIAGMQYSPLTPGAILQMSLYYRDASNNMVTIAATNVVYDTNVFTGDTNFVPITLTTPTVMAGDPWAGQTIGIQFMPVGDVQGGYWDVGNVQLSEGLTPTLINPGLTNGQFTATVVSDATVALEILATTNITDPLSDWTSIGIYTNVTPMTTFIDPATNFSARYYEAIQVPQP